MRDFVCILDAGTYAVGDPPPSGYNAWHEWARVQYRSGLRQFRCHDCRRWNFPQELKGKRCLTCEPKEEDDHD